MSWWTLQGEGGSLCTNNKGHFCLWYNSLLGQPQFPQRRQTFDGVCFTRIELIFCFCSSYTTPWPQWLDFFHFIVNAFRLHKMRIFKIWFPTQQSILQSVALPYSLALSITLIHIIMQTQLRQIADTVNQMNFMAPAFLDSEFQSRMIFKHDYLTLCYLFLSCHILIRLITLTF